MRQKRTILFSVITTILVTCTLFTTAAWASITKPTAPESAVKLWEQSTSASATSGIISLDSTETLDADYFGAKYIPGITIAEPFGPWDNQDIDNTSFSNKHLTSARIPADNFSYQNQLGVLYRNVGNYQGRSIDLKATLENYDFYSNDGITSQMIFWAKTDRIGFCVAGESWIDIRYEFFDSVTGEPISLKAFMTFDDVDWGQAIEIIENPGQLYVPSDSNLRCMNTSNQNLIFLSDAAWCPDTSAHSSNPADSFMTMFEGSYQVQRFYCCYYFREGYVSRKNFLIDYNDTVSMQTFCESLDYFGYSGDPLAATEPSTPTKQVSDRDETGVGNTLDTIKESFSYSIFHNIPNENPEHYYESYTLTDVLPECLELNSASVYNETNSDVTEQFHIQTKGQSISFSPLNLSRSDFYYNTYQFVLNVSIKEGFDLSPYLTEDSEGIPLYAFPNRAQIAIERNGSISKETNETTTYLRTLYQDGQLKLHKLDAITEKPLPEAVFTLYEWDQSKHAFYERETLAYNQDEHYFYSTPLQATAQNLGKYKISETQIPDMYEGAWEETFELTDNQQLFEFTAENMPTAEHTITKNASIVKGETYTHLNPGTPSNPVNISHGDIIEYQIHVERTSAPGYKSGTFTVTDQIPEQCIWSKETLKLTGQITNPCDNSTASILSMKEENGTVTWTIADLDNGEGATLSFQIQAPDKKVLLKNTAYLNLPNEPEHPSNTTFHQTSETEPLPKDTPTKQFTSNNGKTGSTVKPVETGDFTNFYPLLIILTISGITTFFLLYKKRCKK